MTIPVINHIPSRSQSQDTFDANVDAFITELSTAIPYMNTDIATVNSQYSATVTNATAAAASATAAAASALSANGAAGAGMWVSGNSYGTATGQTNTAWSPIDYQTYRKITALSVTTVDPSADRTNWARAVEPPYTHANPKQQAQAIHVTAAASGATGFQQAHNAAVHNMGTGNFGLHGLLVALPDYTPAAQVVLVHKHDGANGIIFTLETNGKLRLQINATTYDSTVAVGLEDTLVANISVMVQRETASAAGIIRFCANGAQVGADVAITAGAPATINNTSICYFMGTSAKREACTLYSTGGFWNRLVSVAEERLRYLVGAAFSDKGAVNTASYTSNFTATVDGFTSTSNATTLAAQDPLGGADLTWLKCTLATTTESWVRRSGNISAGKRYRVDLTYYIPVSATITSISTKDYGATSTISSSAAVTKGAAVTVSLGFVEAGTSTLGALLAVNGGTAGDVWYVKGITYTPIGATSELLSIQPNQIHDTGASDAHVTFPAAGTTLSLFKETGQYNWTTAIAGDTTLTSIVPAGYELDKILFKNSTAGAVSVRLGTTAGGTEIFGLTALNTSATFGGHKTISVSQAFSATAAQTLYLSSTDWTGGGTPPSLTFTMYFRRIS